MGRKAKQRRQSHGSAWHWKQTDCWYYTQPGTKKRMALFDEQGERVRGRDKKVIAEVALAREKLSWASEEGGSSGGEWIVARVCSEYLQYCEAGLAKGTISRGHRDNSSLWLNGLCQHCGALPVAQLKKGHVQSWIDQHETWKSPATRGSVISIVMAAFNRAEELFSIPNPLKGLKKPKAEPRLASFTPEEEQVLYANLEPSFQNFLFAAIHTGLRPFCELAKLTADDIEETARGDDVAGLFAEDEKDPQDSGAPEVAELTRKLMTTAPRGSQRPLFRNTKGDPWQRMTGVVRFLTLKKKVGWDQDPVKGRYSCYTCRHTFVHRMLSGYWTQDVGCSIETLAELIGDTPKVAFEHYGREWGQNYQDPLWNAIGEGRAGGVKVAERTDAKNAAPRKRRPPKSPRASGASKRTSAKGPRK